MSYFMSILLGFIQGVAEFLPISSSGHLSILQNFAGLEYDESGHMFFDVLLHLGTLVAVFIAYRQDIGAIIKDTLALFKKQKTLPGEAPQPKKPSPKVRELIFIAIGTLPLFVILPLFDVIEKLYYNTLVIGVALLLTGCMLYVSDRMPKGKKSEKTMTVLDVVLIGIGQAIATVPGISRSGTTICVGLARGFKREFAVRFAFLLSIPAVLGSNILSIIKAIKAGIDVSLLPIYLVGMITAGVVGYFCIFMVKKIVNNSKFGKFSYYCWAAGLVTIVLSFVL